MPRDSSDDRHKPPLGGAGASGERHPAEDGEADALEFGQQNEPPRGLMRKRPPVVLWILAALFLGGLIALILVGLASG